MNYPDQKTWDKQSIIIKTQEPVLSIDQYGRNIAYSKGNHIIIYNIKKGSQTIIYQAHQERIRSIKFSPDGLSIASGSGNYIQNTDSTIRIWDWVTLRQVGVTLKGHQGVVTSLVFTPQQLIISGSQDKTIRIWDWKQGKQIGEPLYGHKMEVLYVDYSNNLIVSGSLDQTVRIWDARTRQEIHTLNGHIGSVKCVRILANVVYSCGQDMSIRIWSSKCKLLGHKNTIQQIQISAYRLLISASFDKTIRIWCVRKRKQLRILLNQSISTYQSILLSQDANQIIAGSDIGLEIMQFCIHDLQ